MYEQLLLGTIQGIAEWLPVSSEGLIVLVNINLLGKTDTLYGLAQDSLFLHIGTVLASIVYFRYEVWMLLKTALSSTYISKLANTPKRVIRKDKTTFGQMNTQEKTVSFLLLTTIISGVFGIALLSGFDQLSNSLTLYSNMINGLVGISLIATGILLLKTNRPGYLKPEDLSLIDTILLGIVQGFAAIPGLSRSGLTVAALLFKRYDKTTALRLSFLMSIPLVLMGNIILNLDRFSMTTNAFWGVMAAFLFGLATIHLLLQVAQKINFGLFIIGFGILTLVASLL